MCCHVAGFYALKIVEVLTKEQLQRVHIETTIWAKLEHINIVRLVEWWVRKVCICCHTKCRVCISKCLFKM